MKLRGNCDTHTVRGQVTTDRLKLTETYWKVLKSTWKFQCCPCHISYFPIFAFQRPKQKHNFLFILASSDHSHQCQSIMLQNCVRHSTVDYIKQRSKTSIRYTRAHRVCVCVCLWWSRGINFGFEIGQQFSQSSYIYMNCLDAFSWLLKPVENIYTLVCVQYTLQKYNEDIHWYNMTAHWLKLCSKKKKYYFIILMCHKSEYVSKAMKMCESVSTEKCSKVSVQQLLCCSITHKSYIQSTIWSIQCVYWLTWLWIKFHGFRFSQLNSNFFNFWHIDLMHFSCNVIINLWSIFRLSRP